MEALVKMQPVQMQSYGLDTASKSAADKICRLCKNNELSVHFLVGGTQTNLTVIAAALRPHQAVLGVQTAHINVHETGSIEAVGHKIVTVNSDDGKITAQQIEKVMYDQLHDESAEHIVQIKMVYISNSTELGTIYTLSELKEISAVCKKYGLYLFMDGARLSYALTAEDNDITLPDLAELCDVFYMGGTKCGAMFGEAVVISNPVIAEDFRYLIKQRGAMLAKGWLLGVQFDTLLENNLYFEVAKSANKLASQLRETFIQKGYSMLIPGTTNQVFPILPNDLLDKLSKDFTFTMQQMISETHKAVRFCTSWATTQESVDALCEAIEKYSK
jgi:threonine aldolase